MESFKTNPPSKMTLLKLRDFGTDIERAAVDIYLIDSLKENLTQSAIELSATVNTAAEEYLPKIAEYTLAGINALGQMSATASSEYNKTRTQNLTLDTDLLRNQTIEKAVLRGQSVQVATILGLTASSASALGSLNKTIAEEFSKGKADIEKGCPLPNPAVQTKPKAQKEVPATQVGFSFSGTANPTRSH